MVTDFEVIEWVIYKVFATGIIFTGLNHPPAFANQAKLRYIVINHCAQT